MSKFNIESPKARVFYLDECLGGEKVSSILRGAGHRVEMHFDHFPRGTSDEDWLPFVGDKNWILLTQDKGIKKRKLEILALREHKVSAFVVAAKGLRGEEIGQLILQSIPKIERILKKYKPPIVATILRDSVVRLEEGASKYPSRGKR